MFKKLLFIYKNSILFQEQPKQFCDDLFYFYDPNEKEWLGIPKTVISETEVQLLKTLFTFVEERPRAMLSSVKNWYEFLLLDGPIPIKPSYTHCRFIQFQITGHGANQSEIETALKGFFTDDVVIVWENSTRGTIVNEKTQTPLAEEDFQAMLATLESDFFIKTSFFIGKQHPYSEQLRSSFKQEKEFFSFALENLHIPNIYTYERVFPAYLAAHLPLNIKQRIMQEIFDLFHQDPEMFSTIKVYLENNSNASLTAKKLYIHRNTLQYRIDKFAEKTEINLKDFHGAFTVFLACMLFKFQK